MVRPIFVTSMAFAITVTTWLLATGAQTLL